LIAPKAGGELWKDETMRKLGLAAALAAATLGLYTLWRIIRTPGGL